MNSRSTTPFVKDALSRDFIPLWCPYIFAGMPSFGSLLSAPRINPIDDVLKWIIGIIHAPDFTFIFLNYLVFALFMYLFLSALRIDRIVALFCAVAVIFIPQFVAFTAFGHNTKFLVTMLIPLIFILTIKLLKEKNLLYFSLLALAVGFQLIRAHIQVTYYTFLMIGLYFLLKEIAEYRDKRNFKAFLGSAGLLAGAIVVGLLLSSILYASVLDYQRFSIRGGAEGSLDYNYASSWSFHPLEMVTFIIPSFMGFGGSTYWGKMPFTDYPLYFGILVFMLAGIPLILRRNRDTWLMVVLVAFSLLVSFGRHLPILYTPMFEFLPFFDKFRVPSMIHILLDIGVIILAGYGLQGLFEFRDIPRKPQELNRQKRNLARYFYIFGGVVLLLAFFVLFGKSLYMDMAGSGNTPLKDAQRELAYNKTVIDSFKALALVSIAVVLIFQFLKRSISKTILGFSLTALVVIDLWIIDFKIINPQPAADEKAFFAETGAVRYIKNDPGLFRMFPILDEKSSNWYMYHSLQNIEGYSAAKLRIYQEFREETGFGNQGFNAFISKYWRRRANWEPIPLEQISLQRRFFDYAMLDMLNVKYLIVNYLPIYDPRYKEVWRSDSGDRFVYENTTALPRVFFADSTIVLNGRGPIFNYMKSGQFNPRRVAIIEGQAPFKTEAADSNIATVHSYNIHEIKIKASVQSPTVMVLSEVYYPSGWIAYVDGVETKIYKTNYILRSIFLKPGEHDIILRFDPPSYKTGLWISSITVALTVGLAFFSLYRVRSRRKRENIG